MARKRKSRAEERQERYETQQKAWERFRPRLEQVSKPEDITELMKSMPGPDQPGRIHYTSLLFFLETLHPPGGSNATEKQLYINLLKVFQDHGIITAEQTEKSKQLLWAAIKERPYDLC